MRREDQGRLVVGGSSPKEATAVKEARAAGAMARVGLILPLRILTAGCEAGEALRVRFSLPADYRPDVEAGLLRLVLLHSTSSSPQSDATLGALEGVAELSTRKAFVGAGYHVELRSVGDLTLASTAAFAVVECMGSLSAYSHGSAEENPSFGQGSGSGHGDSE